MSRDANLGSWLREAFVKGGKSLTRAVIPATIMDLFDSAGKYGGYRADLERKGAESGWTRTQVEDFHSNLSEASIFTEVDPQTLYDGAIEQFQSGVPIEAIGEDLLRLGEIIKAVNLTPSAIGREGQYIAQVDLSSRDYIGIKDYERKEYFGRILRAEDYFGDSVNLDNVIEKMPIYNKLIGGSGFSGVDEGAYITALSGVAQQYIKKNRDIFGIYGDYMGVSLSNFIDATYRIENNGGILGMLPAEIAKGIQPIKKEGTNYVEYYYNILRKINDYDPEYLKKIYPDASSFAVSQALIHEYKNIKLHAEPYSNYSNSYGEAYLQKKFQENKGDWLIDEYFLNYADGLINWAGYSLNEATFHAFAALSVTGGVNNFPNREMNERMQSYLEDKVGYREPFYSISDSVYGFLGWDWLLELFGLGKEIVKGSKISSRSFDINIEDGYWRQYGARIGSFIEGDELGIKSLNENAGEALSLTAGLFEKSRETVIPIRGLYGLGVPNLTEAPETQFTVTERAAPARHTRRFAPATPPSTRLHRSLPAGKPMRFARVSTPASALEAPTLLELMGRTMPNIEAVWGPPVAPLSDAYLKDGTVFAGLQPASAAVGGVRPKAVRMARPWVPAISDLLPPGLAGSLQGASAALAEMSPQGAFEKVHADAGVSTIKNASSTTNDTKITVNQTVTGQTAPEAAARAVNAELARVANRAADIAAQTPMSDIA